AATTTAPAATTLASLGRRRAGRYGVGSAEDRAIIVVFLAEQLGAGGGDLRAHQLVGSLLAFFFLFPFGRFLRLFCCGSAALFGRCLERRLFGGRCWAGVAGRSRRFV